MAKVKVENKKLYQDKENKCKIQCYNISMKDLILIMSYMFNGMNYCLGNIFYKEDKVYKSSITPDKKKKTTSFWAGNRKGVPPEVLAAATQ